MIRIGICDDVKEEIDKIEQLCQIYMSESNIQCQYIRFYNGEDVLKYCNNVESDKIDLLFLDIEMPVISGIVLKDILKKENRICKIVFVTGHKESIGEVFSCKTLGFISKPASQIEISKVIDVMLEELKENIIVSYKDYQNKTVFISIDSIFYFEACGSYTKVYIEQEKCKNVDSVIICKKLGVIEKEMQECGFIRVHKSYIVNIANIVECGDSILLKNIEKTVPIGRKYKERVKRFYLEYGRVRVKKRL